MRIRIIGLGGLAAVILTLSAGCKPAAPASEGQTPGTREVKNEGSGQSGAIAPAAQLHWLGKKRIAADGNSVSVMTVWNLPESIKLEAQTVDKLALAPFRWLRSGADSNGTGPATNIVSALLRPLAEDLLQEESYAELRKGPNQLQELALAVRLSDAQAGVWETNLASSLEGLTGHRTTPAPAGRKGWVIKPSAAAPGIEFARSGGWVLVGVGAETNATLIELLARVERDRAPSAVRATNFWLELAVDLARFSSALPPDWVPTNGLPRLELNFLGDNLTVRTLGQVTFAQPLGFELEKWNIPTNLIHDPLSSFTAIQGTRAWLSALPVWNRWLPSFAPNQIYFWAQGKLPLQTYLAIPATDASNHVAQLTERLVQEGNPWVATNSLGRFESQTNAVGVIWASLPFADPHLEVIKDGKTDIMFGGLGAPAFTNRPMPVALWQQIEGNPKLIAYDWEMTGARVEGWIYASQLARLLAHLPQVPAESAGIAWLKVLETQLANCGTTITREGPARLGIVRRSSFGMTAAELSLFVDWLESPTFPIGLNTFVSPPPPPPKQRSRPK